VFARSLLTLSKAAQAKYRTWVKRRNADYKQNFGPS
jgi:hypothetical protein